MKKIGIVYAISHAAGEHIKKQIAEINKQSVVVFHECAASDYKSAANDLQKIATLLLKSIDELHRQGAEIIIIAANSVHRAFNIVLEQTKKQYPSIELISIIDATLEEILNKKYKRIAIFGSNSTINSRMYQDKFENFGIRTISLSDPDQEFINELITNGSSFETITSDSIAKMSDITKQLEKLGIEAVIFACTELSLVVKSDALGIPIVDTSKLLAAAAVKHSAKNIQY